MKYLVLYSTKGGHTKVICEALVEAIRASDSAAQCTTLNLNEFMTTNTLTSEGVADMKKYDKLVLGASVIYGNFAKELHQFVRQYHPHLNSFPTAFFVVNLTARKEDKRTPETNPYARKFLRASPWKPTKAAVFAGALYYPRYSFFDRNMIRVIMKLTGGDTDPTTEKVYTDWDSVKAFGADVAAMTADDIPFAHEHAAEVEKEDALQDRTRRFYRMCFMGVVAGVAAVTRVVSGTKLLK
ncbi:protoporphyrinogen oxidase [Strigomonas culicis]|uniref:Protoporphyrinogen oxidase n=1 Tax=Strigomonas culicis TaxID=28005 RepID=G1C9N8_9TRYP|nr:protoporphyrinogen oxidase [Strigomonas culicis]EPY29650.1 protoporphyrinogen oxidase [Strigomonas culicis]|eukprot:EPY29650.1 protoporphyrinogen oxidase [Strigomonas culicis]